MALHQTGIKNRVGGWRRRARLASPFGAALVVVAGWAIAGPKPDTAGLEPELIEVQGQQIPSFDRSDPGRTRFGKLEWRGGLVLTSPSRNFGGWSGLVVDSGGKRVLAVSDAGTWMTADMVYDGDKPAGLGSVKIGPLQSLKGETLRRQRDRDAEAVALIEGSLSAGKLLIGFEGNQRIGRFAVDEAGVSSAKSYVNLPADAKRMQRNAGFEAITTVNGGTYKGSIVAIAERLLDEAGNHTGWIWIEDKPQRFQLTNIDNYDITDAAGLADGGLLVLERRFRWDDGVRMRLRLIRPEELRPGRTIAGEVLLEADREQEIDNMEGLAVHAGAGGETIVTIISDDNFNHLLQRTLLLQFALRGNGLAHAGRDE